MFYHCGHIRTTHFLQPAVTVTRTDASQPRVVVSIPCALCDNEAPTPECPECAGQGMILLRVAPEHAALAANELRALYPR